MKSDLRTMTSQHVLPKDLMELQLGQLDLLTAMYSLEDEITIDDTSRTIVESLRSWCESDNNSPPTLSARNISALLNLAIPEAENVAASERHLTLEFSLPVTYEEDNSSEPPRPSIRVRQPTWLSKAETTRLTTAEGTPDSDDLVGAIEHIKEAALALQLSHSQQDTEGEPTEQQQHHHHLCRVWFYFPSISTRSKRDDLVTHGPGYGLTGFLLAGKPGILCLEGESHKIDQYMRFIKTESWGDIPAHHKKVSERYREEAGGRAFSDMQEITDVLGERRGERANRGDMKALEAWLGERGLGDAFAKVLI